MTCATGLLLLAADRVNMVEGIGADLMRGKAGLAKKVAIGAVVAGGVWYLMQRRRDR